MIILLKEYFLYFCAAHYNIIQELFMSVMFLFVCLSLHISSAVLTRS